MGEVNCCCEEHAQGRGVGEGNHDPATPTIARCCKVHRKVPRVDLVEQLRNTMEYEDLTDEAADEIKRLREALKTLIGWCETYMAYHSKKYEESGLSPPTGLHPAIKEARAALHKEGGGEC